MDTLLTLIIALGGIATGIGAIWTAMLARRQLIEQRRFLGEQNERARGLHPVVLPFAVIAQSALAESPGVFSVVVQLFDGVDGAPDAVVSELRPWDRGDHQYQ